MKVLFVNTQLSTKDANILRSQLFPKSLVLSDIGLSCFYFGVDALAYKRSDYSFLKSFYNFKNYIVFFNLPAGGFLSLFRATFGLRKEFKKYLENDEVDFVYFRNCIDFFILSPVARAKGVKIIYDSRSILFSEVSSKAGISSSFKSFFIKLIEGYSIKKADFLFAVSNSMSSWIEENMSRKPDLVIPCTCNTDIFKPSSEVKYTLRESVGWNQVDTVLVYSGGLSHWQRSEDIINLFSSLCKLDCNYKMLFLTNDINAAEALFNKYEILKSSYLIKKVPHKEIPKWLNVADYSLVLRSKNLLNFVASPIKIAEYLACGIPVIYTSHIGDYSQLIAKSDAGILYDENPEELHLSILRKKSSYNNMSNEARLLSYKFSKEEEFKILSDFFKELNI
ncbi:glycosyltransferase [Pseudoalteromonas lipolytica]|uniref:Glycosyltransferase n=1 Tax=Pseudoalteromonas lipolytica TaxID=570156 RepID=A0AAD0WDG8_9GAMM|nr:glycosyltransferase [Pseudoalteromonas donghaensis]AXV66459.1 glycosyltransferase [Pseudoalteromonas donghaensis]